jgi:ferric-dicitrate binding protein FerR (iron transport regulator)
VRGKVGDVREVVELTQGRGTFHVAHGAGQFRVETSLGTVTALGTEFTVELRSGKGKRTLRVAVTAGTVEVFNNGKRRVLSAGQRRAFGDDGEQNDRDDGDQNDRDDGNREDGKR